MRATSDTAIEDFFPAEAAAIIRTTANAAPTLLG
jgi:hypothetical protein